MRAPEWILLGNRLVRGRAVGLAPWWPAVVWGCGLFETVGCEGGAPLRFEAHRARLGEGLATLGWPAATVPDGHAVRRLLARAGIVGGGVLRVVAARTPRGVQVVSWARRFRPPRRLRRTGARLLSVTLPAGPLAGVKSTSYLAHRWARERAMAAGADAALLVEHDGTVREGDAANLFAAHGGVVVTPPAPRRCLAGVMRGWCLETLREAGVPVEERDLSRAEVVEAEEVWLTSSLGGVVPVRDVDGHPIPVPRHLVGVLEGAGVPAPGYRRGSVEAG